MPMLYAETLFYASLGLCSSGVWLVYKLDGFEWLKKIPDKKGIIIPSLLFLASPFLGVWAMPVLNSTKAVEIIKVLLPIATFILGQTITKIEKQKDSKKKEIELAEMLIFKVKGAIRALVQIEIKFMRANKRMSLDTNDNDKLIFNKEVKSYCKKYNVEIDESLKNLGSYLGAIMTNRGIGNLYHYIKIIKEYIEGIESMEPSPQDRLGTLSDIRLNQLEGYENIMVLTKELLPNSESLLNEYISQLKSERKRLLDVRNLIKKAIDHQNSHGKSNPKKSLEADLYLRVDINTEEDSIKKIETILKRFGTTDY